jgi:hypothetical protein
MIICLMCAWIIDSSSKDTRGSLVCQCHYYNYLEILEECQCDLWYIDIKFHIHIISDCFLERWACMCLNVLNRGSQLSIEVGDDEFAMTTSA